MSKLRGYAYDGYWGTCKFQNVNPTQESTKKKYHRAQDQKQNTRIRTPKINRREKPKQPNIQLNKKRIKKLQWEAAKKQEHNNQPSAKNLPWFLFKRWNNYSPKKRAGWPNFGKIELKKTHGAQYAAWILEISNLRTFSLF